MNDALICEVKSIVATTFLTFPDSMTAAEAFDLFSKRKRFTEQIKVEPPYYGSPELIYEEFIDLYGVIIKLLLHSSLQSRSLINR